MSEPTTTPAFQAPPVPAGSEGAETPASRDDAAAPEPVTDSPKGGKEAVLADLAKERKARQAVQERLKELEPLAAKAKALEDAQKSETERLTEQLEQFKAQAAKAEAENLRLKVATESGLPADLHEFLVGSDEDELRAKAQKLMAATAAATAPRAPAPDPTQGAKPGQGTAQLTRADLARMTPQEIVAAQESGRLDDLMAGRL